MVVPIRPGDREVLPIDRENVPIRRVASGQKPARIAGLAIGTARALVARMPARLQASLQTIVVAIVWTMAIAAPASAAMRAMTLEEALTFARAHQPALRSALARVSAAAADTRVPRAQWLPTVGATLQGFEGTTNNTTASYIGAPKVDLPRIGGTRVTGTGSLSPATSTLAAIGAGQEVFDFGRIAVQSAVADVAYEAERHHADAERLRVDLLVKEAYYGVLGARAVLLAAEDAHQRAQVHRDMAAAGVKSGLHAPIELTRVEAELARFDVGRIRAGGSLRSAQAVLAAAVGADEALLDAAGEAAALPAAPPLSEAVKRAASADPALQEARSRADAADALVRAISAENRPDLALTATLSGRAGTAAPSSGSPSDKYGPLPTVPNWDVGLVLRWNVYDPIVAARRGSAAARAEVARADLSVLTQHEVAAVQEAYVVVEVSQAALSSLGRAVEAAHANYAQAEARFKAGLGTSLELADAETFRTDAEIQLAVGEFDVRRSRAFLARLLAEDL
jgi:outer membrane protein